MKTKRNLLAWFQSFLLILHHVSALEYNRRSLEDFPCDATDIIFVVDTSASITRETFQRYTKFIQEATMTIKEVNKKARIGIVAFNTFAKTIHRLKDTQSLSSLRSTASVFQTRVPCGLSFLDTGLQKAVDMFMLECNPDIQPKRVVILLSDGNMTQRNNKANIVYLASPLEQLEDLQARVYVVALGDTVNAKVLTYILRAQRFKQLFSLSSHGGFLDYLKKGRLDCNLDYLAVHE